MGSQEHLSLEEAYQAAYLWLDHAGEPPIDVTEPAHGAVELISEHYFARVRSSDGAVEQSSVLALLRAARPGKKLIIFSPSGFSPGAVSIAETQSIALFTLDITGDAKPETTRARALVPETEFTPPFAARIAPDEPLWPPPQPDPKPASQPTAAVPAPDQDDDTPTTGSSIARELDEWRDCPVCGTPYHTHAKFCRECGTNLQAASPTPPEQEPGHTPTHRCRTCGSFDIEELG